jgi:hypothetical protein
MDVFLHIGYPKCFSTTLQKEYFNSHPNIFFGGIGYGNGNINFYNKDINLFFESGLIYYRNMLFEKNKLKFKKSINTFLEEAKNQSDIKSCGFSTEHALFNFTPQTIDIDIKLKRLYQIFGDELKIIWIIREPITLIVSLYKEYVNMGYKESLNSFFQWLYKYQDRNFYYELHYFEVYRNILRYFPAKNIIVKQFESYKNKSAVNLGRLFNDISDFLDIPMLRNDVQNRNPSLSEHELVKRLNANQVINYDFGESILNGIEDHRRRVFYNDVLGMGLDEKELFSNILKKREAIRVADKNNDDQFNDANLFGLNRSLLQKMIDEFDLDFKRFDKLFEGKFIEAYNQQRVDILSILKLQ